MRRRLYTGNPVNRAHFLNRGRVAWWMALPSVGGCYGSPTWRDLLGLNPGTLTNGPLWRGSASRPGGAGSLLFDGTNDYVVNATIVNTTTATVAAWVNFAAVPSVLTRVAGFGNGDAAFTFDKILYVDATGHPGAYAYDGGAQTAVATAALSAGAWYRLLFTADATNLRLYVNGVQAATTPCGATFALYSVPSLIAAGSANGYAYPACLLDDFGVWTRALSAAEVWADYDLSRRGYPGVLNRLPATRAFAAAAAPGGGITRLVNGGMLKPGLTGGGLVAA